MADIDLAALGARGVRLNGVADDLAGSGVSAGDFNNDGFIDLIIGAPSLGSDRDEFGGEREGPGRVYVVLGSAVGFPPTVELGALGPGRVIEIVGGEEFRAGRSVASFGDLNGDGIDDILIGSNGFNPGGSLSGAAHVVFGRSSGLPSVIDLAALNGANGFTLVPDEFDYAGRDVSFAGDLNGDGIDDLVIGAPFLGYYTQAPGSVFVVFGRRDGFSATLDLSALNGSNGFRISGEADRDRMGASVSGVGDVNGDGIDDLIVGASRSGAGGAGSGATYVVFGRVGGFDPEISAASLNGTNGFRLVGEDASDVAGSSVSSAGDVNGDGIGDIIVGAAGAGADFPGAAYVVFGRSNGFSSSIDLGALNGANGFRLVGESAGDQAGLAVSGAGDVNGDGFDDVLVGAPFSDARGQDSGAVYVVFGKAGGFAASINLSSLTEAQGIRIVGASGGDDQADELGNALTPVGDVNGDGADDFLIGASDAGEQGGSPGAAFLIFGTPPEDDDAPSSTPSAGDDLLRGTGGTERIAAQGGDDTVRGGGGNDTLLGQAGDDVLRGGGGDDLLKGAIGADRLFGQAADDVLRGGGGNDNLVGGAGADRLFGQGGGDLLKGGGGADRLVGGAGADTLDGGRGADTMIGGAGADTFRFAPGDENDTVQRFQQGIDLVDFKRGVADFDALTVEQQGADVLVSYTRGSILFTNQNAASFGEDDFLF